LPLGAPCPIGRSDVVGDFFLFHLRPRAPVTVDALRTALERTDIGPVTVDDRWLFVDLAHPPPIAAKLGVPGRVVQVLLRHDGVVQIRDGGCLSFRHHGAALLQCAEALHAAFGGALELAGIPFPELAADVHRLVKSGLGLDLFLHVAALTPLVVHAARW